MDYRQLFRQMGLISRQAMLKMNQQAHSCGLDNNLFLLLTRIVENEGLSQSRLAEMVQIDKTTLSRSLGKLEERGLIVKKTNAQNKKFKELYPSSQALKLYDQLIGFENTCASQALQQLTSSELFQLQSILAKIETAKL
ncbi:MarR family winged helix-turn-helix transcriptional regulator [Streptococcus panodentis]|uniref:Transcriptional regulator n=1 Tax=Streptococcus panodentis TaxID=1581472 RepID=A0ABS5AY45_9STRE|nr:MarR family transcriptional regulator [Streptococcus panodentis]MBP2621496.1 transcriptional regulator [Streptococcus panodentis]